MHLVISVFVVLVKLDCAVEARPRNQQEGPPRATRRALTADAAARGRSLLTHGGGRELGHGGHFLVAFVGLVDMAAVLSTPFAGASASAASGFRMEGPSSAKR